MTADQLLLDVQVQPLVAVRGATIQARFENFHASNGWVYTALVAMCRDLQQQGRTRVGIKMLLEVLRWRYDRETTGDPWKINNDYASRYARKISDEHPDLAPLFRTRELRAA